MKVTPEIIEGTWEEISLQADKLNGHRLRVTILPDEEQPVDAKNAAAIAYLQERLKNAPTDPELIRQAEAELEELHQNLNNIRRDRGNLECFSPLPAGGRRTLDEYPSVAS